ncbi:unnamed protein product [Leuciscus chuanchicus]
MRGKKKTPTTLDSEDLEPFDVACTENSRGLLTELSRFRTVEEFLRVDSPQHIPIFATVLQDAKETVYYTYDFDGVVVQLNDISCLTAEIHFLFLGKVNPSKVINHWHI